MPCSTGQLLGKFSEVKPQASQSTCCPLDRLFWQSYRQIQYGIISSMPTRVQGPPIMAGSAGVAVSPVSPEQITSDNVTEVDAYFTHGCPPWHQAYSHLSMSPCCQWGSGETGAPFVGHYHKTSQFIDEHCVYIRDECKSSGSDGLHTYHRALGSISCPFEMLHVCNLCWLPHWSATQLSVLLRAVMLKHTSTLLSCRSAC